jgi:predicted DNA-binding protein
MSTTIRVSKEDKERLTNLAKRLKARSMAEALRRAVAIAEENDERFQGNLAALRKTLLYSGQRGRRTSEHVDEELAKSLHGSGEDRTT